MPDPGQPRPSSPTDLFLTFTALALQGFGGVIAVAQRELVDRKRWMSREEFVEDWSVAQIMPGPNVVNLSLIIGSRYFGRRGALAAMAGIMLAPTLVVMVLAIGYSRYASHPQLAGALRGMGAVAAGLIGATGLRLLSTLRQHPLGWVGVAVLAGATFGAIGLLGLPLAPVTLGLGTAACFLTWRRLPA